MSVIAEAGALAIVPKVKDHSLTSKDDITSPSNESFHYEKGEGSLIGPMPLSSEIPKMPSPGNTNIQHKLNRTLVLMILFATSGFAIWNGEKWRALYKKSAEEEEKEKEEDVEGWRLLYTFHRRNDYLLNAHWAKSDSTAKQQFYQDMFKMSLELAYKKKDFAVDDFKSLLDSLSKWRKSFEGRHLQQLIFFIFLLFVELLWKIYVKRKKFPGEASIDESKFELDVSNCDVAKIILDYMQEFSSDFPDFADSTKYVEYKKEYDQCSDWKPMPGDVIPTDLIPNRKNLNVLTLWEKKIGVKKEKKEE